MSLAPAAADDYDDDEILLRTVIVHDVPDDMEEVVCVYLENPKKNGGPVESSSYNQDTRQLSISFATQQGMNLQARYCYHRKTRFYKYIYTEFCEV